MYRTKQKTIYIHFFFLITVQYKITGVPLFKERNSVLPWLRTIQSSSAGVADRSF